MELQYIVLTIIKILISVPAVLLITNGQTTDAAALIGGHVKNGNASITNATYGFKIDLSDEYTQGIADNATEAVNSEEIPDPSPLIVPGYNLPENIFNRGKPFYLEKDPLTGSVDFDSKAPSLKVYDEYDYEDEPTFDKSSIDRKDGPTSGAHKPSDINQLTPNFHDFLNLPVKYNPDKYVYPLISSSYANTKVQGNTNKHQNHKNYVVTTYKPTRGPMYFTTKNYLGAKDGASNYYGLFGMDSTTKGYYGDGSGASGVSVGIKEVLGDKHDYGHSGLEDHGTKNRYGQSGQEDSTTKNYYELFGFDSPTTKSYYGDKLSTKIPYRDKNFYGETSSTKNLHGDYLHNNNPYGENLSTKNYYGLENPSTVKSHYGDNLSTKHPYGETWSTKNPYGVTLSTNYLHGDFLRTKNPYGENLSTKNNFGTKNNYGQVGQENPSTKGYHSDNLSTKNPYGANPSTKHYGYKNPSTKDYNGHENPGYYDKGKDRPTTKGYFDLSTKKLEDASSEYADLKFTPAGTTSKTLMDSPMNHPSFNEEFNKPSTTTKRTMSLFEQLFGSDYDESTTEIATTRATPPKLFDNLPAIKKTNVLTGSKMGYDTEDVKASTVDANDPEDLEYEYDDQEGVERESEKTSTDGTSTMATTTPVHKVTSLPLGENHVTQFNRAPAISAPNIREKLNAEKVLPPANTFTSIIHPQAPSTSNVHIAPDQDTVSFVVGNHQNVDGGGYVGTSLKERYAGTSPKESPYDNNPFRPVYSVAPEEKDVVVFALKPQGNRVTIQPLKNSEASLAIGVPLSGLHVKPGHVVDDEIDGIEFTKGAKIVFPDDRSTTNTPDLSPPPPPPPPMSNKEVLKLSSKPMFHQLPSDLTPPNEKERVVPQRLDRIRPPWDPRPGHFHAGRPEYARPPRPVQELFKRIDNLPNILPQFRPNMKPHHHHYHPHPSQNYVRQPLLERPSNRPIGFFEKLHPPPLPSSSSSSSKNRKPVDDEKIAEDRSHVPSSKNSLQEPFAFLQAPPKVAVSNRRSGEEHPETLQMIQAKKDKPTKTSFKSNGAPPSNGKDGIEKPLYVVYPVNTPPLKLDAIDYNMKETVVFGTRAAPTLPPSKISPETPQEPDSPPRNDFNYELKERHDAPILKPRPGTFPPVKSDFPYPLERPDPSILKPEADVVGNNLPNESIFLSSNQWNTIEENENYQVAPTTNNQISATLKTHTEKPIAVAYTPTETAKDYDRFSLPNYGSLVIPEIRHGAPNSEITVGAVMRARPQKVDRIDEDSTVPAQDFEAPFQASAYVDHSINKGWSVVRRQEERKDQEATTVVAATTSEFDIENFKPQLEGGFKPIYSYPEDKKDQIGERQE